MSKFKVGDRARVKFIRSPKGSNWYVGAEVTICAIGDDTGRESLGDYIVLCKDGLSAYPKEDQLEPVIEETTTWEAIEAEHGWNPTKEKVNTI